MNNLYRIFLASDNRQHDFILGKNFNSDWHKTKKADYLDENSEQILSLSAEQEKAIRKFNSESHFLRLIEKNHDTGGINIKEILKNLVGFVGVIKKGCPLFAHVTLNI